MYLSYEILYFNEICSMTDRDRGEGYIIFRGVICLRQREQLYTVYCFSLKTLYKHKVKHLYADFFLLISALILTH